MPVEFLADEEAAIFDRYAGPPTRAELDRMFYLDDADMRLVAKRRGDQFSDLRYRTHDDPGVHLSVTGSGPLGA